MAPELRVVPLKTHKEQADECLVKALESMVECARRGQIQHMVCVCTEDSGELVHSIRHRANNLGLIGAMHVILAGLHSEWR